MDKVERQQVAYEYADRRDSATVVIRNTCHCENTEHHQLDAQNTLQSTAIQQHVHRVLSSNVGQTFTEQRAVRCSATGRRIHMQVRPPAKHNKHNAR
jgi:hypothetical protein